MYVGGFTTQKRGHAFYIQRIAAHVPVVDRFLIEPRVRTLGPSELIVVAVASEMLVDRLRSF